MAGDARAGSGGLGVTQGGSSFATIAPDASVAGFPTLLRASGQRGHLRRRRGRDPGHRHGRRDADGPARDADRRPGAAPDLRRAPGAAGDPRRQRGRASAPRCSCAESRPHQGPQRDDPARHRQHGWVGDLAIDLTGPDGTTVRLADHPGGPDNGGDNFTGTVFDDEAGYEHLRGGGALHGQLQAAERPAVSLRRQEPPRHLDAARARPVRGRHRHAAQLGGGDPEGALRHRHDAARHVDRREAGQPDQLDARRSSRSRRTTPERRSSAGSTVPHSRRAGRP